MEDKKQEPVSAEDAQPETSGYSVFDNPAEHRAKKPKAKSKNRAAGLVVAIVLVAALVCGIIFVPKWLPESETEDSTSAASTLTVLSRDSDSFSKIAVTNPQGSFVLISETTQTESTNSDGETESTATTTWSVEGMSAEKISSTAVSAIASAAASITASREITGKTAAQCGLNEPLYTLAVTDATNGDFTVSVAQAEGERYYLTESVDNKVYLVESDAVSSFDFALIDLADTSAVAGFTVPADLSADYTDDDGALETFDTITVAGKNFAQPVVIGPNDDDLFSGYVAYKIFSPIVHPADNADDLVTLLKSGVSCTGAYAFDVSDASKAAVGLDQPDLVLTLAVGGHSFTMQIAKVDDTNCAIITDDSIMIKKVLNSSVSFLDYATSDFYSTLALLRSIDTLSDFRLTCGAEDYDFAVSSETDENDDTVYHVSLDGNALTAENFQDFYAEYVGVAYADFEVTEKDAAAQADMTVTLTGSAGTDVVEFYKSSATKYQLYINGTTIGRVAVGDYNRILKDVRLAAADKAIE